MSVRGEILATLRAARNTSRPGTPRDEVIRDYMCEAEDAPGSRPVLDFLVEMFGDYHVAVHEVTADEIPATTDKILKEKEAPSIVAPAGLDATQRKAVSKGRTLYVGSIERPCTKEELDQTLAVVTASRTAITQSEAIILDGEPDQDRGIINLLPDLHLCVVSASTARPTVLQAVAIVSEHPTRPITWIAGGSATSDIEPVRVDGVHGPQTLVVLLVTDR